MIYKNVQSIQFQIIQSHKHIVFASMNHSTIKNSPFNQVSQLIDSPEEELHQSLEKYLNFPGQQAHTDKLQKEIFLVEIQSINSDLANICKEKFGDLTLISERPDFQWTEIQKTIKLVKTLISSFYRDSDVKKELNTKIRRNEEEIAKQTSINDKLSREKRNLQKDKQSLQLKIKALERQFKEDIEKTKKDKDEAQKRFNQISNKQNQYKNEIRKHQQTIAELQEKIKSKTAIDKGQVKNRFEIIEEIKSYGPSLILSNGENEFNNFFISNFDSNNRAIIEENEYLKKCLQNVYRELHDLLQVKKEVIKRRKGFESALESDAFELESLRPETFNLPKEFSQESIQRLNENLQKFKEAIKVNDLVNDKVQDQKVQCVNNVKALIGSYKEIVESQDKLINRVVLKSKQFKVNEMANIEGKYSRNEEDQLERSKKFLEEQREILMNRNKELQLTRKAMKNTIKRAEQQKKLYNKKRLQTNEQLQVLKKNVEKLPAMIEEQINSMM